MRIDVLGPLRVLRPDGAEVTPRASQQRRALAALAITEPAGVTVDDLVDLLWPGGAPSANALQAVVSKLRRAIAPLDVELTAGRYRLAGEHSTDLADLERLGPDGADVESLLRGTPLPELGEDPAAVALRRHVDGIVGDARARRLESAVHGPDPAAALGELARLTTSHPHDERLWALRMIAQYRSGQQAAALRSFQEARAVLADDLGLEPGPVLREAERRILEQDPLLGPPAEVRETAHQVAGPTGLPARALPARLGSFVGRSAELDELVALLDRHRLVTLLGPGGVGKTTTSLEVGRRFDAAVFVELAAQSDLDSTVRAFARAIGLPDVEQSVLGAPAAVEDPVDRVVDALAASDVLLVVDNCEHVVDPVASIVHRVLLACPRVRVLATSREALSVPGEYVFPLAPLPHDDALALLMDRARSHAAGPAVDHADAASLADLCRRLDGLPLAIELAAARLRTLTVTDLIERLDDRFALLSNGARTVEPRQQTLRAVVDWSHDLLDPVERVVFRRLAAFVGGASPAAAAATCSGIAPEGTPVDAADVADVLARLADKSLVIVEHGADGARWSMLETLRDYASEQLAASGEIERVMTRHAHHFADFLAPALRSLVGVDQVIWFRRVGAERRNLDAALETALAREDAQLALELTTPLGWYFYMTGDIDVGVHSLGEALALPGGSDPDLRAAGLALYGWLLAHGPKVEEATAATAEAVSMVERLEDPWMRGLVMGMHVMANLFAGRVDLSEQLLSDLGRYASESGDPWIQAVSSLVHAEVLQLTGGIADARSAYFDAATAFERHGDQFLHSLALTEAAEIAEMMGEYDQAVAMLHRGLALADEVGFSGHPVAMRARLGNVEILRGNLAEAEAIHRGLLEDMTAARVHWLQAMSLIGLGAIARRRGDLDTAGEHLHRAWHLPRTQTVPFMRGNVLVALGYLSDQRGDHHDALAHQLEGLRVHVQLGAPRQTAFSVEGVAGALAVGTGPEGHRLAARLLGLADTMRRGSGGPMPAAERFDVDRAERRLRAAIGDHEFEQCFAAGAATAADVLLAELLSVSGPAERRA